MVIFRTSPGDEKHALGREPRNVTTGDIPENKNDLRRKTAHKNPLVRVEMLSFPSSPSATMIGGHHQFITRSRSWQPGVVPVVPVAHHQNGLTYQHHYVLASSKAAQFVPSPLAATMSMQFPQSTQQTYYQQYWTPSPSSHSSGCSNSASITPTKSTTFSAYSSSEDVQVQAQSNFQAHDASTIDMLQRRMTAGFYLFDRSHRSKFHSLFPRDCNGDITAKLKSMWQNMAATERDPWVQAAQLPYQQCAALMNLTEYDPTAERQHDFMLPLLMGNSNGTMARGDQPQQQADFFNKNFFTGYSVTLPTGASATSYNMEPSSVYTAVNCHAGGDCVIQALSPPEIRPNFDFYTQRQPQPMQQQQQHHQQALKNCPAGRGVAQGTVRSTKAPRKPRRKNTTQTTTTSSSTRTLSSNGSRDSIPAGSSVAQSKIRKPNNSNRKRSANNKSSATKFATVLSAPEYGGSMFDSGLKSGYSGGFQQQQPPYVNGLANSRASNISAVSTSIAGGWIPPNGNAAPPANNGYPVASAAQGLVRSASISTCENFALRQEHAQRVVQARPSPVVGFTGGSQFATVLAAHDNVASPSSSCDDPHLAWYRSHTHSGSDDLPRSPFTTTTMGSALKDLLSDYTVKQRYQQQQQQQALSFGNSYNNNHQRQMTAEMLMSRRIPSGRDNTGKNGFKAFSPLDNTVPQQQQQQSFMPVANGLNLDDDNHTASSSPHLTGGDSFLINTFAPAINTYVVQQHPHPKPTGSAAAITYDINVFPVHSTEDLIKATAASADEDDDNVTMQQPVVSRLSPSLNCGNGWLPPQQQSLMSCCLHMSSDAMSDYVDADGDSLMLPAAEVAAASASVWDFKATGCARKRFAYGSCSTGNGYRALDPGVALQQFGQFNAFNSGFDFNLDALLAEGVNEKLLDTTAAAALYFINNGKKKKNQTKNRDAATQQREQVRRISTSGTEKTVVTNEKIKKQSAHKHQQKQETPFAALNHDAFYQNMDTFNAAVLENGANGDSRMETAGMELAEIQN